MADNAIFKNRAQNIECSFACVARSAVLLKPNVANILLFNFCELKFIQHGPITIAIDCNGLSLLIFEEQWPNYASGSKSAPNSMRAGFLCPKFDNFAAKIKMSRSQAHLPKRIQAYTQPYPFGGRIKLIIYQIRHELSVTIHVRLRTQYSVSKNMLVWAYSEKNQN